MIVSKYRKPVVSTNLYLSTDLLVAVMLFISGIAFLSKYFVFNADTIENFSIQLIIINFIELAIWFVISGFYYRGLRSYSGIVCFYVIATIYATVPLVVISIDTEIFPFDQLTVRFGMIAQSLGLSFLFLFLHMLIKPSLVRQVDGNIDRFIQRFKPTITGELLVSLLGFLIALIYYKNFLSSGVMDIADSASRVTIVMAAETGKTWLMQYMFFAWLIAISMTAVFLKERPITPWAIRIIQFMAILLFMRAYLIIGNRRELAIFLIFITLMAIQQKKWILFYWALMSLPLLLVLGMTRAMMGLSLADIDFTKNMINLFGEFIFPHFSFLYYSSLPGFEYQWGNSFLLLPNYALPNFGLWQNAPKG